MCPNGKYSTFSIFLSIFFYFSGDDRVLEIGNYSKLENVEIAKKVEKLEISLNDEKKEISKTSDKLESYVKFLLRK